MTCQSWQEKIDTYVDAELPEAEARELESHLRGCVNCSSQVATRSQLKRSVHIAGKQFAPDAEFRKRIQGSIAPKGASQWRMWTLAGAAASATLIAAVLITALWAQHAQRRQLISEVTDLHVATLASSNRVDVVSSDKHTVKPWFQGKLPFTFNLPELQGSPFELIGGKVTYLDQEPGAELLFSVRKHTLSVFIFKDSPELSRAFGAENLTQNLSFNVESWTQGGLRYIIISDASREDVQNLRTRFAAVAL